MINRELQEKLKEFDENKPVVFFSNGYKGDVELTEFDETVVISGKGKISPNPKTALENKTKLIDVFNGSNADGEVDSDFYM